MTEPQRGRGEPFPLGATWDGAGARFSVFSGHAEHVELALFASTEADEPCATVPLRERSADVWHGYVPDVRPGQLYGFRAHGAFAPERGHRFRGGRDLIDPYAKAIAGELRFGRDLFDVPDAIAAKVCRDDSRGRVPRAVVVDDAFAWEDDRPPATPWEQTVLYECHVKGMTARHPDVAPELRGTYLGLASEPVLDHLRALGVTAVELLPIHHALTEPALRARGLTNYWGYNTIGFFAPDRRFARRPAAARPGAVAVGGVGDPVIEFKAMVKALHRAGLEVILDVVYNHTAEGGRNGPTLAFRGLDNRAYYWLDADDPSVYLDCTGCGNNLSFAHPRALALLMDSLRYWVTEMHVDGFRFDLAPALARGRTSMDRLGQFFAIMGQDPVLAPTKRIAEPWDVGADGYVPGSFPPGYAEWNAEYRDTVRRFWRGDAGQVPDLASRLAGSADLFAASGRSPLASVNFVTCHDGFTLHDLVSYGRKRNAANGEHNRDGTDENFSASWGVEGETTDSRVLETRERVARSLIATLALSRGVPMLSHGDELGRTQRGNNNAYCQDGPLSWVDWDLDARGRDRLAFFRRVLALRRALAVFGVGAFFTGERVGPGGPKDVTWLRPDGRELTRSDWARPALRALGMWIAGADRAANPTMKRPSAPSVLLLLNAESRATCFSLPVPARPGAFELVLDTAEADAGGDAPRPVDAPTLRVGAHALAVCVYQESPR